MFFLTQKKTFVKYYFQMVFFFKQKTAYELRISDWSSDVCSSDLEAHATDALAELGTVPRSAARALWDWWATNPAIDVAATDAIEAVTKHDVIAFLTWVAENVGEEARFMHQGMTSSDVLDTCLAVQLKNGREWWRERVWKYV